VAGELVAVMTKTFERPLNAGVTALDVSCENRARKGLPFAALLPIVPGTAPTRAKRTWRAPSSARQSKVSAGDGVFVRRFADYAVAGKYVRWALSRSNATVTDEWNYWHGNAPGLPRGKMAERMGIQTF
jgi:hypothetical protein